MKNILLTLIASVLVSVNAYAQQAFSIKHDEVSNDYYFEEVIEAKGLFDKVIYERAKKWILANMKTVDKNIEFNDEELSIVNNGTIKIDQKSFVTQAIQEGYCNFKYHVWCKEGRYKVRVDNIFYRVLLNQGDRMVTKSDSYADVYDKKKKKMNAYLIEEADTKLSAVIAIMHDAIINDKKEEAKDDW
ncbi:MAG: DUF4468 domain-containing protein [Chitinophagales bacterium]|nr:DUF4468 domain-containing protein [Chitinophagaceae bacterium]MCB9064342.1 DUF4468 domain-containing protein [Chitinophagales bacterium]